MANNRPTAPNLTCPVPKVPTRGYYTDAQSDLNIASIDKFKLVIDLPQIIKNRLRDNERICNGGSLERLELNIWGYVVPDVAINNMDVRYSGQTLNFSSLTRPEFPPLEINFKVDNRFDNYYVIYKWLDIQNDADLSKFDGKQYVRDSKGHLCEYSTNFTIYALDEYDKPVARWEFQDAFPIFLGGIKIDYKETNEIESNITFKFNSFKMLLD